MRPRLLHIETFKCDSCDKPFSYGDVYGCYVLPANAEISVRSECAWCMTCDDVVAAEHIPDLPSLKRALADVESNGLDDDELEFASLIETTPEQLLAERLDMWRNYVLWRSERDSPPRCLKCGATTLVELGSPLIHPNCGGTLQTESVGHGFPSGMIRYSPEGIRLDDSAVT